MVNVAIVGLGWVGINRHLKTIQESPLFKLIGVIDRHEEKAADIANQYNIEYHHQGETLEEIEWLETVDLIVISTPPMSHFKLAKQALDKSKHVLLEKPFTMDLEEAKHLLEYAQIQSKLLMIVHNFQFSRSFTRLLGDIESGKLGKIKSVVARQFSNPHRRLPQWYESLPLGLFYDESPHLLYLLNRLGTGRLNLISSTLIGNNEGKITPQTVEAIYMDESGIPMSLHMSFEAPVSEWQVLVLGEKALGVVDLFRDIYIKLPNDGEHKSFQVIRTSISATMQHWLQTIYSGVFHLQGKLRYGNDKMYQSAYDAIQTGQKPSFHSDQDALIVLEQQQKIIDQEVIAPKVNTERVNA